MRVYVTGIARTGTTFVMEILHELGFRIHYEWKPDWRGGHEANLFPNLDCGDYPLVELAYIPVSQYETAYISEQCVQNWEKVWQQYDAIKCLGSAGGYILGAMLQVGLGPDLVVICHRDFAEIERKYGSVQAILSSVIDDKIRGDICWIYAIYGYISAITTWFNLPTVSIQYPRFGEDADYAANKLAQALCVGYDQFKQAWYRANRFLLKSS